MRSSERLEARVPVDRRIVLLIPSSLRLSFGWYGTSVIADSKLCPSLTERYRFTVPILLVITHINPILVVGVFPKRQNSVDVAVMEVENGIIA